MPRRQKKYHFIYKTTNKLNGKYYIGMHSTDNLNDGYLGSGNRLRYSVRKYGEENFEREILEFVDSREELKKREEEVVNLDEIAKKDCMNLTIGGEGGDRRTGKKHKKESIEKIRSSLKGKTKSEETKNKIRQSSKGRGLGKKLSQEIKDKISLSKKGIPSKLKGVPRSEEVKRKISENLKGKNTGKRKPMTEEVKNKIGIANKYKCTKKVVQINKKGNVVRVWNSISEAEKELGTYHIGKVCNGIRKTSGGFYWKFL